MDTKINWLGGMSFTGTSDSGFTVNLGASTEVGGQNDGFRPLELMAVSLGGCTAMDVISITTKKRQDITGFEVKVHAEQAQEHPKVFTSAVIEYVITGHQVNESAVVRAIELSALRYCPAQEMLAQVLPIELRYQIFEDEGGGKRSLVKSGIYPPPEQAAEK
jgi:putative redox protein